VTPSLASAGRSARRDLRRAATCAVALAVRGRLQATLRPQNNHRGEVTLAPAHGTGNQRSSGYGEVGHTVRWSSTSWADGRVESRKGAYRPGACREVLVVSGTEWRISSGLAVPHQRGWVLMMVFGRRVSWQGTPADARVAALLPPPTQPHHRLAVRLAGAPPGLSAATRRCLGQHLSPIQVALAHIRPRQPGFARSGLYAGRVSPRRQDAAPPPADPC